MNEYVLSATLELKDNFTAQVKKAQSGFSSFSKSLQDVSPAVDRAAAEMQRAGVAAVGLSQKAAKAKTSLSGIRGVYAATIRAKDEASQTISRVKTGLRQFQGKTYTAVVNVRQNLSGGNGPLNQMKNGLSNMAGGALMGTSMQMAGAAGMGFGIYDAVKGYMDFEKEMSAVRAISGASAADFQRLTEKAIQMGAETKFSALESAQALEYMGMAGWKTDEMMAGLPGVMNLAAASGEDLASVSDIVTDALSAFRLQASDAAMFSDVLAAAATNSNTSVGKMGYTFKYVAPLAGAMGYSIQDMAVAIGTMANAGIKSETAGTSLRSLLTRLADPPKEAADAMSQLGISITDAAGNMKPFRQILRDLRAGFRDLTPAQKASVASALAGQDAMGGLLAIVNESDDKFNSLADAIDHSNGAAEKMAKTRLDNLAGDLEYLSGDWDTFTMRLMQGNAASGLRSFVQEADRVLTVFSNSVQQNGLGVQAVLEGLGTAFKDLKDKALAMDGVGSVLAGGALVAGLVKIAGLAKRAKDYLTGLATSRPASLPGGGSMPSDMVINARTVIVNGSTAPGSGTPTPGGGPSRQPKSAPGGSRLSRLARLASRWGLGLTLANGMLDMAMAPEEQRGQAAGGAIGSTVGWAAGAKAGAAAGAGIGAMFGGVGAAPGAAIGGAIGGIAGSLGGGALGQAIGGMDWDGITQQFAAKNQEWVATYTQSCEQLKAAGQDWEQSIHQTLDNFASYMQAKTGEAQSFASGCWDLIAQTAAEKNQAWSYSFSQAKDSACNALSELGEWASSTWSRIVDGANSAQGGIESAWSSITGWFDANVWGPLKASAASAWEDISSKASSISLPSLPSFDFNIGSLIPGHATGAVNFAGGWTEVNERGGELIRLPGNSWIYPHATTERMLQKQFSQAGGAVMPSVQVSGNTFVVREEADIDKIAYTLARLIQQSQLNYGGVY